MAKFFVLQTLWSQSAGRVLHPGEQAALDDLSPEQIEKLTAANVITPWVDTPSASAGATTSNPPTAAPGDGVRAADPTLLAG